MSGTSTRSVLTGVIPMGGASTGGEEGHLPYEWRIWAA